jgi:hypothetical protein
VREDAFHRFAQPHRSARNASISAADAAPLSTICSQATCDRSIPEKRHFRGAIVISGPVTFFWNIAREPVQRRWIFAGMSVWNRAITETGSVGSPSEEESRDRNQAWVLSRRAHALQAIRVPGIGSNLGLPLTSASHAASFISSSSSCSHFGGGGGTSCGSSGASTTSFRWDRAPPELRDIREEAAPR